MVEQREPRAALCDHIFETERPTRGVGVHDEDERQQARFAQSCARCAGHVIHAGNVVDLDAVKRERIPRERLSVDG